MATLGFAFLIVSFAASCAAVLALTASRFARGSARSSMVSDADTNKATAQKSSVAMLTRIGRACVAVCAAGLVICCAILVACFMAGDVSILYVLEERSLSTDSLAWLYKLSGLWAGRSGSLLLWTTLIAVFACIILSRSAIQARRNAPDGAATDRIARARRIDDVAMAVACAVVAAFSGVLLFSNGSMPFDPTPANYFDADGNLTAAASLHSMNQLLEHWAMAIHPPLLFIGYAGLTIPFAYAIAALVENDPSPLWVERSSRFLLASWLFLGAGIGLGAVWAYVVLGWGGYWGWDPVENASLLSWLVCVALVHTFTVYRTRGGFKRWAIMCACLAFTFVIVATFITRSGIVDSVHAFAGDPVSLTLFGGLIALSLIVGAVGLALRWKSFGPDEEGGDDVENMLSKDAAYYFNNVIMIVSALLLTYMTLSSALPRWMPFGGASLGAVAYEAIARPLGIFYLLILAVCPLLSWGKTDPAKFFRQARVPGACALALFAVLAAAWGLWLVPTYNAVMAKVNTHSNTLLEAGPPWYYNGLALVGLLVASLLFFNALFMFARAIKAPARRASSIGGGFAHIAMAVILVGLIGSNMYVYEESGYMAFDPQTAHGEPFQVGKYRLEYAGENVTDNSESNNSVLYEVVFDVYRDGAYIGQAAPSVQVNVATQQQKLNAAVVGFPEEDLFIVYRGVNANNDFSMDVRINPLINLVWIGFVMLMAGTFAALVGRRSRRDGKNVTASVESGDPQEEGRAISDGEADG